MLVTMSRAMFDSLDNVALAWACIRPTIEQIRGKTIIVKSRVYAQLTVGQRALLAFWILYGHAQHGVAQFYGEVSYLLAEVDLWQFLRAGMRHIGDATMLRVIEEMEKVYLDITAAHRLECPQWSCSVTERLVAEPEVRAKVVRFDAVFLEILPATLTRVCAHIRDHPDEFVRFEGC